MFKIWGKITTTKKRTIVKVFRKLPCLDSFLTLDEFLTSWVIWDSCSWVTSIYTHFSPSPFQENLGIQENPGISLLESTLLIIAISLSKRIKVQENLGNCRKNEPYFQEFFSNAQVEVDFRSYFIPLCTCM